MQSGSRRQAMRYARRRPDTESESEAPKPPSTPEQPTDAADEGQASEDLASSRSTETSTSASASASSPLQQLASGARAAAAAAIAAVGGPTGALAAVAAVAVVGAGVGLWLWRKSAGSNSKQQRRERVARRRCNDSNSTHAAGERALDVGSSGADNGTTEADPVANGTAHAAGPKAGKGKAKAPEAPQQPGPLSKMKPSPNCVALADGSACVVRRKIAADNSCLFNAVGYVMHHSHNKAPWLRNVVSREVSGDPQSYTSAFLGMPNSAYCQWIVNRMNWGGGIELAILSKHYRREITAWNIETARAHVFGEEAGHPKQVMVIYNGNHYDALAISSHPRASPDDDVTEFNPRTKRGKMILAAAQKLVELNRKGSKFVASSSPKQSSPALRCTEAGCGTELATAEDAKAHATATGHNSFEEFSS